jgi:hypothetical protein
MANCLIIAAAIFFHFLFLVPSAFGDYTGTTYFSSKNSYPSQMTLDELNVISLPHIGVAKGAQVRLEILVPAGINYLKFVPSSNSFQYGVRLGGSIETLGGSNGDTILLYNTLTNSKEHIAYIYIDNTRGSRTFRLSGHTSLVMLARGDTTEYDFWRHNEVLPVETDDFHTYDAATDFSHQKGFLDDEGWAVSVASDQSGYLAYGPYVDTLIPGNRTAHFTLMIDNNDADNSIVARIEVYNFMTNTILASKNIHRREFISPLTYQDFSLGYELPQPETKNVIEFRVLWHGTSFIKFTNVIDYLNCDTLAQCEESRSIIGTLTGDIAETYLPLDVMHQIGRIEGDGWVVSTQNDQLGFHTYGPYATDLPLGQKAVNFTLLIDNNSAENNIIATLEVFDFASGDILAQRQIRRMDFLNPMAVQTFSLPYTLSAPNHVIEFRILWHGIAYMKLFKIEDLTL